MSTHHPDDPSTASQPAPPPLPCREYPDLWFDTRPGAVAIAQERCAQCPLAAACRAWAVARDEQFGTWGGSTEAERAERRKARRELQDPPMLLTHRRQVAA